jgi:hypothetical protein
MLLVYREIRPPSRRQSAIRRLGPLTFTRRSESNGENHQRAIVRGRITQAQHRCVRLHFVRIERQDRPVLLQCWRTHSRVFRWRVTSAKERQVPQTAPDMNLHAQETVCINIFDKWSCPHHQTNQEGPNISPRSRISFLRYPRCALASVT